MSRLVFPWGVEPQSLEPESNILSIELREHNLTLIFCTYGVFRSQNY